jgi:hypothetical protein
MEDQVIEEWLGEIQIREIHSYGEMTQVAIQAMRLELMIRWKKRGYNWAFLVWEKL